VIRVVRTSGGWARVSFDPSGRIGLGVGLERFDEDGWELWEDQWIWWRRHGKTLPEFIAAGLEVPSQEAEVLAGDIVGSWEAEARARPGGNADGLTSGCWVAFYCGLACIVLVALWGLGLTVWLLAT